MIICDICKGKIEDNHIQISVRGEQRHSFYDVGLERTFFETCSVSCAMELLNQIKMLIPKVKKNA